MYVDFFHKLYIPLSYNYISKTLFSKARSLMCTKIEDFRLPGAIDADLSAVTLKRSRWLLINKQMIFEKTKKNDYFWIIPRNYVCIM